MGWDAFLDKSWQRCQGKGLACPPDFMSIGSVMVVHGYKHTRERWAKVRSDVVSKLNYYSLDVLIFEKLCQERMNTFETKP